MLKNYLVSAWRYVLRNKLFTLINMTGLAIGMTAFMLIVQYGLHELNYDTFWTNSDRIFRVQLDRYNKGEITTRWAGGCAGIGPDMKSDFPEVKYFTRLHKSNALLANGDVFFKEENAFYASEDFFKVFGYPLSDGGKDALKGPNKIVISKTLAHKYFGNENPMGKTLRNNGKVSYLVTGVFDDFPAHSHMKIDALMSFATYAILTGNKDESQLNSWQWDGFLTYIQLNDQSDALKLEAKLPAFVKKREGERLKGFDADMVFHLQPLKSIHLDSNFMEEIQANGDRSTTYFLLIIAVLIIVIAWINYINLSTAKSIERAREVGVRKVMGSFRSQLIKQFLFESTLFNVVAVMMAIGAVVVLTPWFNEITGRPIGFLLFKQSMFWVWAGLVIMGGALLSGIYPAFILSAYKPVEVLKGQFRNTSQGTFFRKGMVIIQFVASITLIAGTFTVYRQINFMRSEKLGVNIDQTLIMRSPNITDSTYRLKFEALKQRYTQLPEVSEVCASSSVPGSQPGWNAGGIRKLSQRPEESNQYRVIEMDHDFVKIYGLELIAGRGFVGGTKGEEKKILVNESGLKLMGFKKAEESLNEQIFFWGDTFRIAGVLKNYRQESLKKSFEPLVFRYSPSPGGFYSVKFNTSHVQESIASFEKEWKDLFPGNPFSYFFLDEHYNAQYKADQDFGKVFGVFSGLAIFIACLGLFGLSSLTILQRTKEIGVRKVLGASVTSILSLVSKDYLTLISVSVMLSVPLTWWVMNIWLQAFASRIPLTWVIFAVPSLVVMVIALLTVSVHTLRAAYANPSRSLRYE